MTKQKDMFSNNPELIGGTFNNFYTGNASGGVLVLRQQDSGDTYYDGDLTPYLRGLGAQIPQAINQPQKMAQLLASARLNLKWYVELSYSSDLLADAQACLLYVERAAFHCEFRTGINVRGIAQSGETKWQS